MERRKPYFKQNQLLREPKEISKQKDTASLSLSIRDQPHFETKTRKTKIFLFQQIGTIRDGKTTFGAGTPCRDQECLGYFPHNALKPQNSKKNVCLSKWPCSSFRNPKRCPEDLNRGGEKTKTLSERAKNPRSPWVLRKRKGIRKKTIQKQNIKIFYILSMAGSPGWVSGQVSPGQNKLHCLLHTVFGSQVHLASFWAYVLQAQYEL